MKGTNPRVRMGGTQPVSQIEARRFYGTGRRLREVSTRLCAASRDRDPRLCRPRCCQYRCRRHRRRHRHLARILTVPRRQAFRAPNSSAVHSRLALGERCAGATWSDPLPKVPGFHRKARRGSDDDRVNLSDSRLGGAAPIATIFSFYLSLRIGPTRAAEIRRGYLQGK